MNAPSCLPRRFLSAPLRPSPISSVGDLFKYHKGRNGHDHKTSPWAPAVCKHCENYKDGRWLSRIDCAKCAKVCPSNLPVDRLVTIKSAECTAAWNVLRSAPPKVRCIS